MTIIFLGDAPSVATPRYKVVPNRMVAGDLVGQIKGDEFYVDQSDEWLFDWERQDPKCYARKRQRDGVIKLGSPI